MALGLVATIAVAWIYTWRGAAAMDAMTANMQPHFAMGMMNMHPWGAADWFGLFTMWAVMMAAMMLPSAAPLVLLVVGIYRRRGDAAARTASAAFGAGYLLTWTGFSAAAASAQLALHEAAILADDMRLHSALAAGVVLVVAGVYQWLPIKNTCLTQCQSPLGFLSRHWREGTTGGFVMGLHHGLFCIGCCWLMMLLLFVVGVMNLVWIAALTAVVLLEKLVPRGDLIARIAGVAVVAWGLYLIVLV